MEQEVLALKGNVKKTVGPTVEKEADLEIRAAKVREAVVGMSYRDAKRFVVDVVDNIGVRY